MVKASEESLEALIRGGVGGGGGFGGGKQRPSRASPLRSLMLVPDHIRNNLDLVFSSQTNAS